MLVIETNISYGYGEKIVDHQSRVIKVNSWEEYVATYENNSPEKYTGTMFGHNFPSTCRVSNLQYDDFHLSCDIYGRFTSKKLAYKLQAEFDLVLNGY